MDGRVHVVLGWHTCRLRLCCRGRALERDADRVRVLRGTHQRLHLFELFRAVLEASGAVSIVVQSNAVLATTMLHTFGGPATSQSVLFHDKVSTSHRPPGATFREPIPTEAPDVPEINSSGMESWKSKAKSRRAAAFFFITTGLMATSTWKRGNCFAAEVLARFLSRN